MNFTKLHYQNKPLLIANVWDADSAMIAQQVGYQALGTSSAAIAATLGYEDGEAMSFDELLYIVSRIKSISDLPLSVDVEAGFGRTANEITTNLKRLSQLGVVGINLEYSKVINGIRQLFDKLGELGVNRISMGNFIHSAIQSKLKDLMLNIKSQQSFSGVFTHESYR
ncbi:isocitrate lyase/phosphoenolpyruvate mutase family protein [Xenorhabdus thuongxuanensis]|uniref:Carboxyvinyl-carboxyphosphonate phosphorylmutase n=1 Tax=Xenorhabdus thuongxuanensis TaxID=1873484 RepID=A0A1Q5U7M1_9GAMM|nr:isocitrate lyase/phosphoenolpyruvate mutase family protein [Xenorhabdus thuongxuanensis]OKP08477.1 carboxyvinyl-carboxyphosphonate phosphorylmutase [Xenorhabdus thuongxuanensis]